jgi:hypothetical protein
MSSEYVYIGYMSEEGTGDLSDPAARLALTVALMALCDLQSDPELLQLVEQRLAKILAGVYEGAIALLAERTNGEPVSRIAWSTTGGVAAFVDGQWTSPVTGEAVAVGEGWVVVETGEGRKASETRQPLTPSETDYADIERRFREWARSWSTVPTSDGRDSVSTNDSQSQTQTWLETLQPRLAGCVVERDIDGAWAITYPRAPVVSGGESLSEPMLF